MPQIIEGNFSGSSFTFGIVVSRFNKLICDRLLEGALDILSRHGADGGSIKIAWVPGVFEIPLVAQAMAKTGLYSAIICLGAVIRGSTPHFDFVCSEVTKGVAHVSLENGIPICFGVLTTDTIEQAIERAGTKHGNKGADAAMGALEMASLLDFLTKQSKTRNF